MKQKKQKQMLSKNTIRKLLLILESAHNAIKEHKNFNLAEALISEYCNAIPQTAVDASDTKSILNALRTRDMHLLMAVIDAEIERLRTEKIKLLRKEIIQS